MTPSEVPELNVPKATEQERLFGLDIRIVEAARLVKKNEDYYYLQEGRLQQVIAGVTAMGLSQTYRRSLSEWVYRVTGQEQDKQSEDLLQKWAQVFLQHNELFRSSSNHPGHFSLIARRSVEKKELDGSQRDRPPVSEGVLRLLIETAITIHGKQFNHRADRRWGVSLFVPFFGSLIGAILGLAGGLGTVWLKQKLNGSP